MKKILKTVVVIIISIILCSTCTLASSKTDLENQQSEINGQIKDKQIELNQIKGAISSAVEEIQKVSDTIESYEDEISSLSSKLSELQKTINETEAKLKQAQKDYDDQQELLDERLVAIYEAGDASYLDILLSSGNIVEAISNYYLVSQLAQADTDLLEQMEKEKQEIEDAKTKLEESKKEIVSVKAQKESKAVELKAQKTQKDQKVAALSDDQKELQAELDQFNKDKQAIASKLAEIARQEAANGSGKDNISNTPSKSGYISPIAGLTKSNITCGYYGYSGHTGVDFSGGLYGKTVRAVKSGTVVISTAKYGSIKNYGSNGTYVGSYASYGEYIIINHHDGTMTLYAHGKPGSRLVSAGQEVSQGQAIMQVGNTGNVLPRPTPSNPLGGTHLHFEVRVNGSPVNPTPYLP